MNPLKTPTTPEDRLPDQIISWIRRDGGDNALLLMTVDGRVRPHVMMLARDQIVVISDAQIRLAVGETTQSAENIRLRSSATLVIYDEALACVIKSHAVVPPRPLMPGLVGVSLEIEEVRLDAPAATEASARLLTGLRFEGRSFRNDIKEKLLGL